jgi:hypothetical protein
MKVVLLGDSIRQQYAGAVKGLLGGDFEVWAPDDNCRFAKYTLRGLFDWASAMEGADIVHWNNGLWDVCDIFDDGYFTKPEVYVDNMIRIAKILQKRYGTVIFATTTPVTADNPHNKNADIIRYNELLVPELEKLGVIINDLHSTVYPNIDTMIRKDDKIHLTDEGIEVCAKQVADAILRAAKK